ncbi:MAG: 1-acyl-sn-glycerol-3-phosphate acyltransferase [Lachnospiraceae bacterium]|nr:1-acyl-sn-glycerol-3-phosphate acyltransferase [Lachnospiraceae bacterium]
MKHSNRYYERVRKVVSFILRPWFRHMFLLDETPFPELPERFLLVSNHVVNIDPLLVIYRTRRYMHFVATEHLFSMGLVSRIICALGDPIPRAQGGSAASTVMDILRKLKNEGSVGIAAEGNCTWDGVTAPFLPATGKMARASGVPLVTVRVQGYLASPRWAFTRRKGPVKISLAGIYPPEELRKMKPEEINALIARDIHVDAYADQAADPQRYPGKRLAEGMEHALVLCPRCRQMDTFRSRDDRFTCSCGFSVRYDEWGYFTEVSESGEGGEPPFRTVRDWDAWQKEYLAGLAPEALPAGEDSAMQLLRIEEHRRTQEAAGPLRFDASGLRLGDRFFPFEEIAGLAVRYKGVVSFSDKEGNFYEILKEKKKVRYHGRKYLLLYQRLKGANQ